MSDDLKPIRDVQEIAAQINKTLTAISSTLKYMYRQYEEFSDGRLEMMEYIREIEDQIDANRYDLRDHDRYVDKLIDFLYDLGTQRDEAISDRDVLRMRQKLNVDEAYRRGWQDALARVESDLEALRRGAAELAANRKTSK
jgi:septal ring factor EnvC (AmiA/AmiB activator)